MDISRALRRKLRSRWQLAAAVFLITTGGLFAAIMIARRLSSLTGRNGPEITSHNQAKWDGSTAQISKLDVEDGRNELYRNLEADNRRLDTLEEERKRLSSSSASTRHSSPIDSQGSHTISADHNVREQLASALIHLLDLEKRDKEDNPEIIAVRQQVTRLQAKMVRAAADAPPSSPAQQKYPSDNNQVQVDQINTEIIRCGAEIVSDLQRLSQLTSPARQAETPQYPGNLGSASTTENHTSTGAPNRTSAAPVNNVPSLVPTRTWIFRLSIRSILAISIALGVVFSFLAVILRDRLDRPLRDEEQLREMLPATAEYIGSIPRMEVP